jgi:hypothetical protein
LLFQNIVQMMSDCHYSTALSVIVGLCLIGCGSKENSELQTQVSSPTEEAPIATPEPSPASEPGPVVTLAGEPFLQGGSGVPPNTSGITPMDVVSGVPAPTPAVQKYPREATATGNNPNLPPGVPIPDFSGIVGHSNYRIESVTMGTAAPGEGPVGPDGNVIDPNTFLGPAAPSISEDTQPMVIPNNSEGVEGRKLDPSEAPNLPPGR